MRNYPSATFDAAALEVKPTRHGKLYIFDRRINPMTCCNLLDGKYPAEQIAKGYKSSALIYSNWVVKSEFRALKKRLAFLYLNAHASQGHRGIIGEAVNTLAANTAGFPSHHLGAACINHLTGNVSVFYSRIIDGKSVENILEETPIGANDFIRSIVIALLDTIKLGILHADCNISNVFYNLTTKKIKLIDFELAVKINCADEVAMGIMMSDFFDWRLEKFISRENFILLLNDTLPAHLTEKQIHTVIKLLTQYGSRRLERAERSQRLDLVSNGHPALATLLGQQCRSGVPPR
jgi:uncharacterized protein (DUF433 family)